MNNLNSQALDTEVGYKPLINSRVFKNEPGLAKKETGTLAEYCLQVQTLHHYNVIIICFKGFNP